MAQKGPNGKINYQMEYEKLAKEFWELQKIPKTEEEQRYDQLCNNLEQMAKEYRAEIDKLASQNASLHEKYSEKVEIDKEFDSLVEQEQLLQSILSSF